MWLWHRYTFFRKSKFHENTVYFTKFNGKIFPPSHQCHHVTAILPSKINVQHTDSHVYMYITRFRIFLSSEYVTKGLKLKKLTRPQLNDPIARYKRDNGIVQLLQFLWCIPTANNSQRKEIKFWLNPSWPLYVFTKYTVNNIRNRNKPCWLSCFMQFISYASSNADHFQWKRTIKYNFAQAGVNVP